MHVIQFTQGHSGTGMLFNPRDAFSSEVQTMNFTWRRLEGIYRKIGWIWTIIWLEDYYWCQCWGRPCRSAHHFADRPGLPPCMHLGHLMTSDHSSDPRRKQAWQHLNHWPWRCSLVARQAGILCKKLWSIIAIQICYCYPYHVPCWRCCCRIACESRKLRVLLAEFLNHLRQSKPPRMHDGFHWAIIQTVFNSSSTSRNELQGYQDHPETFRIH
jgi:hypothetical protein